MTPSCDPAVWFPAIRAGSGTDVFTERLAAGLQQRGIRAEITWLPHRAEYAPWTVAKPKPPAWANIAHVNTWLPPYFLPRGMPIIATMHHCVHDPALTPYKGLLQALYHRLSIYHLEKQVLRRADAITAVSHYTVKPTQMAFGIGPIRVIHNGIDFDGLFHSASKNKPNHPFRLLFVGNSSRLKGFDLLFPILERLGADFELWITADSPKTQKLHSHNLRFLGTRLPIEEIARCYQQADALLFPSRLEGFGLAALEAQACSLPVIATRGSSLPEVIEDGATGILCPQDDIEAFADAACRLASDIGLWQAMRTAARIRVLSHFSLDAMINDYLDMYRICLSSDYGPG